MTENVRIRMIGSKIIVCMLSVVSNILSVDPFVIVA